MKKRFFCLLIGLVLVYGISGLACAAEEERQTVEVTLDGERVADLSAVMYGWTSYVSFEEGVKMLRPEAEVTVENGTLYASAEDFVMMAAAGASYVTVNDRFLYVADQVKANEDGKPLVPTRILAQALGAGIQWTGRVEFTSGGSPLSAENIPYDEETLELLARVITHESGNQPLEGKMAVGNVILNRVNNSRFPNTVSEVIYQKNQFPGATTMEPNEESILAARLCLEGANVVPDAYYFNGVGKSCWASRNKPLVKVIDGHAFYGI